MESIKRSAHIIENDTALLSVVRLNSCRAASRLAQKLQNFVSTSVSTVLVQNFRFVDPVPFPQNVAVGHHLVKVIN